MKTILKYITFIFSILTVTSPVFSAENFMKTVKTNSALVFSRAVVIVFCID
ncbi:MAG: hypothetical protein H6Q20_1042 [Bacteroidetes bacterium]|nr:hypothetical protein [Bacteroidota bacterium]